jgi:hypothetical protein
VKSQTKSKWAIVTALSVTWMFLDPGVAVAQEHVLPLAELQQQMRSAGETRMAHVADIDRVFSLPAASDALKKANITPAQVHLAVSQLSDQELSKLAMKARSVEQDVEGGIIVGILALIGLVVVILIVVAVVSGD